MPGTRSTSSGLFLAACVLVPASLSFSFGSLRPGREAVLSTPPVERQAVQRVSGHASGASLPEPSTCGIVMVSLLSAAFTRRAARARKTCTVRRAEGEGGGSLMGGMLGALKKDEEERAEEEAKGRVDSPGRPGTSGMDQFLDKDIEEGDLEEYMKDLEAKQDESLERLTRYDLYPSKQYVLYLAKMNAVKTWTRDGPDGKNIGCLEVQIAILTERIRNLVLHAREFKPDHACRMKLVMLVARRRKYLDKLAAKNLDSYMKIREELKIRHVYRMECLIGRLGAYTYPIKDRPRAPGRKTLNRLKKAKRLMTNRLANYLRQGKDQKIIHRTQKKLNARRWLARSYDEVASMVSEKPQTTYVDPLNLP